MVNDHHYDNIGKGVVQAPLEDTDKQQELPNVSEEVAGLPGRRARGNVIFWLMRRLACLLQQNDASPELVYRLAGVLDCGILSQWGIDPRGMAKSRSWSCSFISTMLLGVTETDNPRAPGYGCPDVPSAKAMTRERSTVLHWQLLQKFLRCEQCVAYRVIRRHNGRNEFTAVDIPSIAFLNGQSLLSPDDEASNHPMAVCGLCLFSPVNGHTAGAYPLTLYHISSGVHVDNMMAAHASLEPSFFSFHLEMWNEFCLSVQDQWATRLTQDIDAFNEARKCLHLLPPSRITKEMRLHLLRVGEAFPGTRNSRPCDAPTLRWHPGSAFADIYQHRRHQATRCIFWSLRTWAFSCRQGSIRSSTATSAHT